MRFCGGGLDIFEFEFVGGGGAVGNCLNRI